MTDQLEIALTRTLSEAAQAAPEPRVGLLDTVQTRYLNRRRRRYAVVAGIAVFAVIGVSVAAGAGAFTRHEPPVDRPVVVAVPAVTAGDEPPIAEVWPEAYHRVSAAFADGRGFSIEGMIDRGTALIALRSRPADLRALRPDEPTELWALDLEANRAQRLVRLPAPATRRHSSAASHFAIGSGQIVWWDSYLTDVEPYTRIWKVPVTGGEPVLVSTVTGRTFGASGDRLTVDGDAAHFSTAQPGGVWTVPLAGGEPVRVPGTDGHLILEWPWVGTLSGSGVFTDLRNAETGERRDATRLHGMSHPVCSVAYCVGELDGRPVARTREGSKTIPLPGPLGANAGPPALDRFVRLSLGDSGYPHILYDIESGIAGDLGLDAQDDNKHYPIGPEEPAQRWFVWTTDDYRTYHLIDLAAIR